MTTKRGISPVKPVSGEYGSQRIVTILSRAVPAL
jgi:hypothetical protein